MDGATWLKVGAWVESISSSRSFLDRCSHLSMSRFGDSSNFPAVGAYGIHDFERRLLSAGLVEALKYVCSRRQRCYVMQN